MFEIDHIFIMSDYEAPEAELLIELGFTEGEPNIHPNQGTSNRRFFFHNVMLELLWVSNPDEAKSSLTKPTHLWDRWKNRKNDISPFGICVRSVGNCVSGLPFEYWEYKPTYLDNEQSILVGNSSDNLKEPMIFTTPFGARPDSKGINPSFQHSNGLKELTSICLNTPIQNKLSQSMRCIENIESVSISKSKQHSLEISFDSELNGKQKNLQPGLPLLVRW